MTSPTKLNWGIKESLLSYIESLDDGTIELESPARREGTGFAFSLAPNRTDFDEEKFYGLLQFEGAVHMSGYHGAMNITIRDPQLIIKSGQGVLSVEVESVFSGKRFDPIAVVKRVDGVETPTFITRLTSEGQMLFGPQYSPGQELSPFTLG